MNPKTIIALALFACVPAVAHDPHVPAHDPDGIVHSAEIVVNGFDVRHNPAQGGSRHFRENTSFEAKASVDVRAAVKWSVGASERAGVTYDAEITLPPGAAVKDGGAAAVTAVAWETPTTWTLTIGHQRAGHDSETWLAWLRVIVRKRGEDEPVRNVLLPVTIIHKRNTPFGLAA